MQVSSKKSPCPCCGRTKDPDCRFSDDLILCHCGSTSGPPQHLRLRDVIQIQGRPWQLMKINAGYDGAAHCFKPHQERERTHRQESWHRPPSAEHMAMQQAHRSMAILGLEQFFEQFQQTWNIGDFHSLPAAQLQQSFGLIYAAEQKGLTLARSLQTIWREHPDLRDRHRDRFDSCIRNLKAQRQDVDHFRSHYLGEAI